MKTTVIILALISSVCFGQNDTIYLFENYIELDGHKYNLLENGIRTGDWIEFSIEDNTFIQSLGSGDGVHSHDYIYTEYRPLNEGEINGIEIRTSENETDTVNGEIIYSENYKRITNRVPPDKYYIIGKGSYQNNKKQGDWIYFHKNGKLKKEINYNNGLPSSGFIIFRPDETEMIQVTLIKVIDGGEYWLVTKYSETGEEIEKRRYIIDELKELY